MNRQLSANAAVSPPQQQRQIVACLDLPQHLRGADATSIAAVAVSVANALVRAGWTHIGRDNSDLKFTRGGKNLDLMALLPSLASGQITYEAWAAFCMPLGISSLPVELVLRKPEAPPVVAPTWRNPFDEAAASVAGTPPPPPPRRWENFKEAAYVCGAMLLVLVVLALKVDRVTNAFSGDPNDHLAGHIGIEGDTEVPVDGKANLPEDVIRVSYTPQDHEFETTANGIQDDFTGKMRAVRSWSVNRWRPSGRTYMSVELYDWKVNLDDPAQLATWLDERNRVEESSAGAYVEPTVATYRGRKAWVWEFNTRTSGFWEYTMRVPSGTRSLQFTCRAVREDVGQQFIDRCKGLAKSAQLGRGI